MRVSERLQCTTLLHNSNSEMEKSPDNISKAFDCLSQELLIAKPDAYGFDKNTLKLVNSYISNRKQRVQINDKYSLVYSYSLFGIPQGTILGPFHMRHALFSRRL